MAGIVFVLANMHFNIIIQKTWVASYALSEQYRRKSDSTGVNWGYMVLAAATIH
jgi:hypothetical protein